MCQSGSIYHHNGLVLLLLVGQTILEEYLYVVDRATCPGQNTCDTNADVRSVCGS